MEQRVAALVVAAGKGSRLSTSPSDLPKQYRRIGSQTILTHTLNRFGRHPEIDTITCVIAEGDQDLYQTALAESDAETKEKLSLPIIGGATRQGSVRNGLEALAQAAATFVLIHDAARPFLHQHTITDNIEKLKSGAQAVLTAIPVVDTIKRVSGKQLETIDRSTLQAAQTPQSFPLMTILGLHRLAEQEQQDSFTDDIGLAEWQGLEIAISEGSSDNFKITTQADLAKAESLSAQMTSSAHPTQHPLAALLDVRIGQGYDVHAFDEGDAVILGGISIPHSRKLKGHSDADVVLHAITDAILGALADGDIGAHFPPSDPQWKGAASDQFLVDALRRVEMRGGRVAHIDVTVVCEAPKIGPHREALRKSIARICELPIGRVSVKATTSEKLGFTGRKEGIACLATTTVRLPFDDDDK